MLSICFHQLKLIILAKIVCNRESYDELCTYHYLVYCTVAQSWIRNLESSTHIPVGMSSVQTGYCDRTGHLIGLWAKLLLLEASARKLCLNGFTSLQIKRFGVKIMLLCIVKSKTLYMHVHMQSWCLMLHEHTNSMVY